MPVPLTVKKYLIRQYVATAIDGTFSVPDLLRSMGQSVPAVESAEFESWRVAFEKVRQDLLG